MIPEIPDIQTAESPEQIIARLEKKIEDLEKLLARKATIPQFSVKGDPAPDMITALRQIFNTGGK